MGWLLPALTDDKLKNQQDVVRNERRQRYEVRPYGEVWVWLFENLYPAGHPYHIPTIGKHEDIENATMTDVQDFFKNGILQTMHPWLFVVILILQLQKIYSKNTLEKYREVKMYLL